MGTKGTSSRHGFVLFFAVEVGEESDPRFFTLGFVGVCVSSPRLY